ncbi:MAG TPA: hypothetical protein V6D14_22540 [Coleofasciculaceae cyanobacterium]
MPRAKVSSKLGEDRYLAIAGEGDRTNVGFEPKKAITSPNHPWRVEKHCDRFLRRTPFVIPNQGDSASSSLFQQCPRNVLRESP